ncbi:hypothetical protein [Micromonospora sp. NPDC092111]|uniref:hypothetical protein n=1 Tax=Micromonospora sp. NPDC092111 TaxID=3364289 RepID=UPI0037F9386F
MDDPRMISVRRFSLQGSIWRQHAPMMEQVVRWINENESTFGRRVRVTHDGRRSAVIAETAFRRAAVNAPLFEQDEAAERAAGDLISLLPRGQFGDLPLTASERLEVVLIQQNLLRLANTLEVPAYFYPVPGCGVVNSAFGDMADGSHLIEIKTVARPFRGTDLRQMLIYCAMKYASNQSVDEISLYNPRRARLFTSSLDEISFAVSGRTGVELVNDLVDAMVGFQVSA